MTSDEICNRVADLKWFHAIDFGDFASSGRFEQGTPQNITLYGVFDYLNQIDLSNARLLDIGTYDGLVAFGAKALGAEHVVAVDTFRNDCFLLARNILDYNEEVDYHPGLQIGELETVFNSKGYDVIVCAGVIYHMLYPQQAFIVNKRLLADDGLLIIETPFAHDVEGAHLIFNGVEQYVNEPYTYFVPSLSALKGMANLSGFKVIAERILNAPKRVTLLLKSVSREELIEDSDTPSFIIQMLKRDTCDNVFRFKEYEKIERREANVRINSPVEESRVIFPKNENPEFPYHPAIDKPGLGTTRFETARGNLIER